MRWVRAAGALVLLAIALAAAPPARAQDRPAEEDIFGGEKKEPPPVSPAAPPAGEPAPPAPPAEPPPSTPPGSGDSTRDDAILGTPDAAPRLSTEVAPSDPLRIGGQFYLRAQTSGLEDQAPHEWSVTSPSLLDGYFDARPNPRVRGFVLARMTFDPTVSQPFTGLPGGFDSTMGTGMAAATTAPASRGPQMALDQLWLRFDIKRAVFVTAGRQHVRWGTARFWTPTDFLHVRKRNPLDVFDPRTGSTMLKLHVPWEARGWNFYAYGITEGAGPTLGDLAGAARAEIVLGTNELGLGALVQRNRKPRLAADLSTGIWDLDLYGEVALRYGSEIDRVGYAPGAPLPSGAPFTTLVDTRYPVYRESGIKPQVVGGLTYQYRYNDNDVWTLGGEYFYNGLGYGDPAVYPGLVLPHASPLQDSVSFFYLGRHYAALFLLVPRPYSWDLTTFTLSTLGNLSDRSFITRFDYGLTLLTHLRFEAFVSVHYGRSNGEFRFEIQGLQLGPLAVPPRPPGLVDVGVALRVAL
jgi:hypothetical protein